jgi:hypothetical protein
MNKWIKVALAVGATVVITTYAVKKVNEALDFLQEDPTEDVPDGVDGRPVGGRDEHWVPNLPPAAQKVLDEALARFPEGWSRRVRPEPKEKEESVWGQTAQEDLASS